MTAFFNYEKECVLKAYVLDDKLQLSEAIRDAISPLSV